MSAPTGAPQPDEPLARGRAALARGAWEDARTSFEAALAGRDAPAAALEGLSWAGWWLADEQLTMRSRERAFRAYRAAGDDGAAARVAAWLAIDHREFRGEGAVARGWLRRAQRLVEPLPESADHGWVKLLAADLALNLDVDLPATERMSLEAAELGRRLAVADLEAVGLAQGGIALVLQGQVEAGMARLDEASAIAASEELQLPVSTGWALCCVISACDGVGDFARAAEWCHAMRRFTDRWGGRQIVGVCRSAYGRVLATHGDWPAAEQELTAAVGDLTAARPGMAAAGLVRLGELRMRQGRAEEARELLERAGPVGLVGLGQLALEVDDDARAAVDMADRALRGMPADAPLQRLPALELLARGRARLGEAQAAHEALAEIERTILPLQTPYLRGRARLAAGEVAAASGDREAARQACEDAVDCFASGSAPYEAAIARVELAAVLDALGLDRRAAREREAARETFTSLGAHRDLERLAQAVEQTAAAAHGQLSPRELDVLRLVAQGMSDAEIAAQLVVSQHTVHRHVANVRAKLRLPSRAAAVAYAAREGLL